MTPKKPAPDPYRPIRKDAVIAKPLPEVFDFFTSHFTAWWPLASHSLGRESSGGVDFPLNPGRRITEILGDGSLAVWGVVSTFTRPSQLCFTWHPGRAAREATDVEVTFTSEDKQTTRVTLVHSGWSKLAGEGIDWRGEYDRGWDFVLNECFARRCSEK